MEPAFIARRHDEVRTALEQLAVETAVPAGHGERVRRDRRSELVHLGIRTPDRRRRVAQGFSFTRDPDDAALETWAGIWNVADTADVMFAVLDHWRVRVPRGVDPTFWSAASGWIDRIENWAHADDLARVYSWVLAAHTDHVLPDLRTWSLDDDQWRRRVAVTSMVHHTGEHAVFMPVDDVVSVVENCVDDQRQRVQQAVGWVLRETSRVYPDEVARFLGGHADGMSRAAVRRATERLAPAERARFV